MVHYSSNFLLLIGMVGGSSASTNSSTAKQLMVQEPRNITDRSTGLCSIAVQEIEYFHKTFNGRNTEYQNDADFNHISRLNARLQAYNHHFFHNQSELSQSQSPRFVLFSVGLNEGSLLRTFLRCQTDSISHNFDIQAELIKAAKKTFRKKKTGKMATLLHFETLGMSNETTTGHVGGNTVTAGLYSEDEVASKIGLPRAKTKVCH